MVLLAPRLDGIRGDMRNLNRPLPGSLVVLGGSPIVVVQIMIVRDKIVHFRQWLGQDAWFTRREGVHGRKYHYRDTALQGLLKRTVVILL